ncbi:tyrosine-protein phosphatase [Luteimicrobium subarcticum]|uniref:Protein-tyrosine phosphatase n=1 Tax=Luteimicrobium subarcticum TaxID=620910 RepID=A0A2M8WS49_9MICO|nr:tyrosine-protein phosphatase [Luteimicrobium subarcticum]PJI93777.1 protein-tyrosine phosphatase [Luteimicrobium subarcticum]
MTLNRTPLLAGVALVAGTLAVSVTAPAATAATTSAATSVSPSTAVSPFDIPFTAAQVTDHGDGTFTITWNAPGVQKVRIYTGANQLGIDTRTVVAQGGSTGSVTVTVKAAADRRWFRLVPDRGLPLTLADRLVRLDGTVNFRDLGGYRTTDGHWVAMGKVYRADALNNLSDADLAKLQRLGVRTDVDLRTADERASAPDRVPAGTKYVVDDVLGGSVTTSFNPTTPDAAAQLMVDAEKTMVSSTSGKAAYADLFDLVEYRPGAIVFHCTAGKDRTGWGSAALLTTLGVPQETVQADYLLSNDYRAAANAATLAQMPAAYAAIYKPLLDVRPEYLASGFDEVQSAYGSWSTYLSKGIDQNLFDRVVLRAELLQG